ncbi:hypothetical protein Scep_013989 [Stephania cephalantha]|uniref:Uncharacterized protein n=1 Tax=Stephania cephalantha TaxID=152367 RepID=A0AAP0J0H5_9MAGN
MDEWRGNQGRSYHHQHHNHQRPPQLRSQLPRKPPVANSGSWQPTVPSWEKRFCYAVGSFSWRRLLESQKVMILYKNVIQWNDSAGEEAFHNAKTRFWAEMNGFECDISLPDPDMYIDVVDWDCEIDPELLLDLERQPEPPVEDENDGKVEFCGDSLFFMNQPVVCSGWGDTEEVPSRVENDWTSVPQLGNCDELPGSNADNSWDQYCAETSVSGLDKRTETVPVRTWGDGGDGRWGWNENGEAEDVKSWRPHEGWNDNGLSENVKSSRPHDGWGTWNVHQQKRESNNHNFYKHKNSKNQIDDYNQDHWRRNGRGRKRSNFGNEHYTADKKPLAPRQWNGFNSCGPVTHRGYGEIQYSWNFEKQIL